ncbi:hypothetical protein BTM25_01200 [Actinomadura rubteroloni]|uniref:Uncharacterized protein n=1 Tax=Actinomadura rubteroloni TaxID=1926885 RepID=A0A2P4UKZ4_9ACTN|nr:hypothetical protein [Actinomadura rubteroloni]POM25737.1 hypothetical protein BTM25_01200 [Actinomadura rubteroloni]
MRCPVCGSDTTPALPRCTHCGALLDTNPNAGGDATARDEPVRPPWATDPPAGHEPPSAAGPRPGGHEPAPGAFDPSPGYDGGYGSRAGGSERSPAGRSAPPGGHEPPPGGYGSSLGGHESEPGGFPPSAGGHAPPPGGSGPSAGGFDPGRAGREPAGGGFESATARDDAPGAGFGLPPAGPRHETTALSPEPWNVPVPPPPPEERTTPLADEPWNHPPIWQPPPPRRRSPVPWIALAAGIVVLAVVAVGIVLWPSGPKEQSGGTPTSVGASASTIAESPTPDGDVHVQAQAVDALLTEMGSTRRELGSAIENGCTASDLQAVRDARQSQLAKAQSLDVGALTNGAEMRDALVRALQASVDSNSRYLDQAPGCPTDSDPVIAAANERASAAKREFLGYWNTVAPAENLPSRSEGDI